MKVSRVTVDITRITYVTPFMRSDGGEGALSYAEKNELIITVETSRGQRYKKTEFFYPDDLVSPLEVILARACKDVVDHLRKVDHHAEERPSAR